MKAIAPVDLGYGISLIEDFDLKIEGRTGTYVIHDEELTIVETCASPSVPYIIQGFEDLGLKLEDLRWIIVTHIHLDHAGGAGLLLEKCPNAKVIVHPRGYRHLSNPTKLIAGARAVYGDKFDQLFDPIVPIPEEQLIAKDDGETLSIGDRTLTFYNTPGHANHHFSIHDSKSNGIFTGDTIGVHYPQLRENNLNLYLPSTSPNQFDPEAMLASTKRIEELGVDRIYFGHYGVSEEPHEVYRQIREWLPLFVEAGEMAVTQTDDFETIYIKTREHLTHKTMSFLHEKGIANDHPVYKILELDINVCAMGLADYVKKKKATV
ncbi:MBL fold metallo-hydrolase [Bacillus solimangrovi]|uniref:MBL fold metallo-hydrolase n=1 Tax=Bacillus solimangrovi TaxID=1305675 RepID=A0A1E5LJH0_9BACI|nr:MBL fold metallo-hydrolase [Bacillus solimangrovi]OEH94230.1 MBL fold metallo-hydrolase [Bacillus solimangrovi]